MRLISFFYLITCILSQPAYGSYDSKETASYGPLIQAAYTYPTGHILRLKTSEQQSGLSGYYALFNGLAISKAIKTDTIDLKALEPLFNKKKLAALTSIKGDLRTILREKRRGADTTLVTAEELQTLITHEKNTNPNAYKDIEISICTFHAKQMSSDISFENEATVTKLLKSSKKLTVLLLVPLQPRKTLRSGKQSPEDKWIALVIKQWKEGANTKRIYFVADSAEHSPILHNEILLALFKKIEGNEFTFKKALVDAPEHHPLSELVIKSNGSKFEESTCYKDILAGEAAWNKERKRIFKPIPTLLGIATGALLIGGYLWLKNKRASVQTMPTPQIQV